jgi:hypothetical protein
LITLGKHRSKIIPQWWENSSLSNYFTILIYYYLIILLICFYLWSNIFIIGMKLSYISMLPTLFVLLQFKFFENSRFSNVEIEKIVKNMIIILYGIWNKRRQDKPLQRLGQVWATSGPRATYGSPSTLMWPASYIWSFLNSYIDYENTLNTKKVPVLLQKQPYNQFTRTCIGPQIPNVSLMWPAKPKELSTPGMGDKLR